MSGRGRPTFNKRQKEQKRKEKQQEKAATREERKLASKPLPDEEAIAAEAEAFLAEQAREVREALEALEAAQNSDGSLPPGSADPLAPLSRRENQ